MESFVRINKWRFDFRHMRATKITRNFQGDIHLDVRDFRIFEGKVYSDNLVLPGFFDIGEQRLDEKIVQAYTSYEFEKQFL